MECCHLDRLPECQYRERDRQLFESIAQAEVQIPVLKVI
jgi:hypothetical protein